MGSLGLLSVTLHKRLGIIFTQLFPQYLRRPVSYYKTHMQKTMEQLAIHNALEGIGIRVTSTRQVGTEPHTYAANISGGLTDEQIARLVRGVRERNIVVKYVTHWASTVKVRVCGAHSDGVEPFRKT